FSRDCSSDVCSSDLGSRRPKSTYFPPPSDLIHSLARSERFLWIFTDLSRRSRVTIYRLSCAYFRGVPRPPFRHGTHAPAAADLGRAGTRTPPMTTPLRGRAGRRRSEIVRSCGGSV